MTRILCHDEILGTTETVMLFVTHEAAEAALQTYLKVEEDMDVIYWIEDVED